MISRLHHRSFGHVRRCALAAFSLLLLLSSAVASAEAADQRPNILLIVADDMGFADLGSFGGEIPTPNLDALAYAGTRFTDFQVAPACSPTRAMLLTGVDNHRAGFGNLAEEFSPNQKGQTGYEGFLNNSVVTVATLLRDAGYHTYLSGKWHLGLTPEVGPKSRGFERSVAQLSGASHFADMQPSYSPDPNAVAKYLQDDVPLKELPDNFHYSSQFHAQNIVDYIEQDKDSGKPFFAFLSFTAPHWPLQLPEDALDNNKGRYDAGYDVLYEQRWQNMTRMGLIDGDAAKPPRPPKAVPWASLTAAQQRTEARSMEIYAGMVQQMDHYTGQVISYLKSSGRLKNTLVVFLSDNGAEGHDMDDTWPVDKFPKIRGIIDGRFDFSYDNMGRPNSYTMYGPGWARAGAPHLRMYKAFSSEGGTRVSAFASFPGRIKAGVINPALISVKDIAPTLLEFAGVAAHKGQYRGRQVEPMTGWSLSKLLQSGEPAPAFERRELGMELIGKYGFRQGQWKMTNMPSPYGSGSAELYDLSNDPGETRNLARQHPEKLGELLGKWRDYARDNGVILPDWLSGY
jgi:arylsulfatase